MKKFKFGSGNERGVSLVEAALTVVIISLTVVVWLKVIRIITEGTQISKNNLRGHNLALSKLEDYKNMATNSSYAGNWRYVTQTPLAYSYSFTSLAVLEDKAFTWKVVGSFVDVQELTLTASAVETNMITITAEVVWSDRTGPNKITLTTSATNFR